MVSPQNDIAALRARVAKAEQSAARKIQRNKREKGVELAGSQFDPRKPSANINSMRSRDLLAYERRLKSFTNRRTQFEAGVRGAPLPRQDWERYKATETKLRAQAEKALEPMKDVKLPGPGDETVGQRAAKIRTKHPTATNQGYLPPERQPKNVKDADSLKKLTASNRKRMTKKFRVDEHERARVEFGKMVEVFKDDSLSKAIDKLTTAQFDMLWNLTKFADAVSLTYHHIKSKNTAKQQAPQEVIESQLSQAKTLVEWVSQFNTKGKRK